MYDQRFGFDPAQIDKVIVDRADYLIRYLLDQRLDKYYQGKVEEILSKRSEVESALVNFLAAGAELFRAASKLGETKAP